MEQISSTHTYTNTYSTTDICDSIESYKTCPQLSKQRNVRDFKANITGVHVAFSFLVYVLLWFLFGLKISILPNFKQSIHKIMTLGSKNHERKIQRKQKRLQHLITNDSGVICCDTPTKVIRKTVHPSLRAELKQKFLIIYKLFLYLCIDFPLEFSNMQCRFINGSRSNCIGYRIYEIR